MFQCPAPIVNMPPSPPNHDWLKAIVAALLGLLVGLIGDPIRVQISRWFEKRRIENALYSEMARIYVNAELAPDKPNVIWPELGDALVEVKTPILDYYYGKNQEYFFEDGVLHDLNSTLVETMIVSSMDENNTVEKKRKAILASIDKACFSEALNLKKFVSVKNRFEKREQDRIEAERVAKPMAEVIDKIRHTRTSASPEEKSSQPDSDSLDGQ